jgi:hypothetical protein
MHHIQVACDGETFTFLCEAVFLRERCASNLKRNEGGAQHLG